MKRLLLFGFTIFVLSLSNVAVANTPETATATPHKLPSSVIDGIEVPFEVLDYAQMKYQGHAVTQVVRSSHNGQPAYQLRVDNDDMLYDDDCIFLWYDMKWKLLGEGEAAAPSRPTFNQPSEKPREENEGPRPERNRPIRPERPEPVEPDQTGPDEDGAEEEENFEDEFEVPRGRGRGRN